MKLRLLTFATFVLFAFPVSAQAQTFTNAAPFVSPNPTDEIEGNVFSLYPTEIPVSGMVGAITDVNVTLHGVSTSGVFSYGRFLLVAPDGTALVLLSESGGSASNVKLVLDQQAAAFVPTAATPLGSNGSTVTYKPSVYGPIPQYAFPPPVVLPADITPDLDRLNGRVANGAWKLYANHAYSYMGYNTIAINSGWSLDVETTGDITPPSLTRPAVSGRTIGFDLDEAASIQFRVDRIAKGVKSKTRCLAPKKGRKGKSCSRYVPLPGAIDTLGVSGPNAFAWNGRIAGKKLAPGKYRLTAIAKDAAGNASPTTTFTVTIKKPKKKKR